MPGPSAERSPRALLAVASVITGLALVSFAVAVLEDPVGVPDASSLYLLVVVVVAVGFGTRAAIAAAVGAFLVYDFLFIDPRYTFTVRDPREWLNLLMLLVVGIVVGQLAGLQRQRADAAEARERESRALFGVSRALATSASTDQALPQLIATVREEAAMDRVWVRLDEDGGSDRVVADSGGSTFPPSPSAHLVLRRMPGDEPAVWTRIHEPSRFRGRSAGPASRDAVFRVRLTAGDETLGSLWGSRPRAKGEPSRSQTRLMAAAADQVGGAVQRDRLAARATEAEVARRSEAVKTALLDSVSHDLRTPLASIRAAAGSLMDPLVAWEPAEARTTAAAIDREAERLNRLVSNLLDMSRIEAGGLKPQARPHVLADLVEGTVERLTPILEPRAVGLEVPLDLPPVLVDEVYVDQVLTNLLENAARYTPPASRIRIAAAADGGEARLTVEDDGPGVPPDALPRLFEKFFRVPRSREGSRRGTGIGMAVVRGLVEAMGGHVVARRSDLGGLAVDLTLPLAASQGPVAHRPAAVGATTISGSGPDGR